MIGLVIEIVNVGDFDFDTELDPEAETLKLLESERLKLALEENVDEWDKLAVCEELKLRLREKVAEIEILWE